MGARIIQLAEVRASRMLRRSTAHLADEPALPEPCDLASRFQFWAGASGKRYVHTIYSLLDCPELPQANYILVRREASGTRVALSIGRLAHAVGSLNLAEIRHRGAQLGANEVHVHLLAETAKQMKLVEFDLRTGQSQHAAEAASRNARH